MTDKCDLPTDDGATLHPWYGPCDSLAAGECAECLKMSGDKSQTTALPKLNRLQWGELYRVREGNGTYWPNGREIATLKALANRRLVTFALGYGWSILPEAASALAAYVKENPHAFPMTPTTGTRP